jgi:hypothetical protein
MAHRSLFPAVDRSTARRSLFEPSIDLRLIDPYFAPSIDPWPIDPYFGPSIDLWLVYPYFWPSILILRHRSIFSAVDAYFGPSKPTPGTAIPIQEVPDIDVCLALWEQAWYHAAQLSPF